MRALSNLINLNQPDLVLFVGEALVGNDAVDQLTKFNARLADLCPDPSQRHLIDGIVLTKFDTIDDKVRARLAPGACGRLAGRRRRPRGVPWGL
jgi:signal recognition particle receptor subunit alpha